MGTYNYKLLSEFCSFMNFSMAYFYFHSSPSIFQFPVPTTCYIFLGPIGYLRVYCFISTYLWIFQISLWYWFLILFTMAEECIISNFLNLWKLVLWFNIEPILENIPCALEKHEYSLLLGGMFYWCLFSLVGLQGSISLLFFCLISLSIIQFKLLKCPTIIVQLFSPSIVPVLASYISGSRLSCVYMFIIVIYIILMVSFSFLYMVSLISVNIFKTVDNRKSWSSTSNI